MNIDWIVELHMDDDRNALTSKSHASTPHHQPTPTSTPTTQESRNTKNPHHQPTATGHTRKPGNPYRGIPIGESLYKGSPLHEGSPLYEYPQEHPYGRVPIGESL